MKKWVYKWLECILRDKDFNESGFNPPSQTLPTSLLAQSVQSFSFQRPHPPPLRKQPLWVQPFLYIYFVVFSIWQCVVSLIYIYSCNTVKVTKKTSR